MDDEESSRGQVEVPTQKKDRAQLLKTHRAYLKKQDQNPTTARAVKQPGLADAYPPSTKSIREVEIVPLSELRVGVHHRGQGVILRTISNAYRGVASVSVVEDGHRSFDKLAIYNQSDSSILFNLPEGCVVAVKEPYYKCNAGGDDDYMICVDQPSDVVLMRSNDPIIPGPLRPEVRKTAEEWKKAGDQAFLAKDLPTAVFSYTEGIDAASNESALKSDLLSKRAGTNLALGKFDDAQADALASRTGASADWKCYFTAGRAAYGLRDYQASHDHLRRALDLNPAASAAGRELDRCAARLAEARQGGHDFRRLYESLTPRGVHLDSASFTARTRAADPPSPHGRGLVAAGPLVRAQHGAQLRRRRARVARAERLAGKRPAPGGGLVPEAAIRSMERLAREMEEAHEPEVYDGLPRLMLVCPTMWLLQAYKGRKKHAKVVATALRVLRNFGFAIEGDEDVEGLFRAGERQRMPSVMTIHVVTALKEAAHAHVSMGRKDVGSRYEEAAKRGYIIMTGFEDDLSLLDGA